MRNLFRPIFILILVMLTMGFLSACGVLGGGLRTGDDINAPFREGDTGFVVCTEGCRNQGQCGVTTIQEPEESRDVDVVLISPGNPATRNHGALLETNVAVSVLEVRQVRMFREINNEPFNMNFYKIRNGPETGRVIEGWTHGMCVTNRAQN